MGRGTQIQRPPTAAYGRVTQHSRDARNEQLSRVRSRSPLPFSHKCRWLVVVLLILAGCGTTASPVAQQRTATAGGSSVTTTPALPPAPVRVYLAFGASVPFSHALRLITDLGIQPAAPCNSAHYIPGSNWREWVPVLLPDFYAQSHQLWAELTPLAPPDWRARLHAPPENAHITPDPQNFCRSPPLQHLCPPPPPAPTPPEHLQ